MDRLKECIKTDFLLNIRNASFWGSVFFVFAICWMEFFYMLPNDTVAGNSLALSSWVTQIFIILGVLFGYFLATRETLEIEELFLSLNAYYVKKFSKLFLLLIYGLLLFFICSFVCIFGLYRIRAEQILYLSAIKYIFLYWIFPFFISAVFAMAISNKIKQKLKYFLIIVLILILGPMLPTILEPLVDATTGLYKYVSIFNIGPINAAKPMNILFGYDLQIDKYICDICLLISGAIFYLCDKYSNKKFYIFGSVIGAISLLFACFVNYSYIEHKYDYDIAMNMYYEYNDSTMDSNSDAENYSSLQYNVTKMDIKLAEGYHLKFDVTMTIIPQEPLEYIEFVLYHGFEIQSIDLNDKNIDFIVSNDTVKILNNWNSGEEYVLKIKYTGRPAAHMYSDVDEWILPAYLAWYPTKGTGNNIYYSNDLFDLNFTKYTTDTTQYSISYEGKGNGYCNLSNSGNHSWSGKTSNVTFLCSDWVKEYTLQNGINVIYPVLCKNYEKVLPEYVEWLNSFIPLIDNSNLYTDSLNTIFIVCDTTYTGHGEKINLQDNHSLIEITRAYIYGNSLLNPNLSIYPLIKEVYLNNTFEDEFSYLFQTTYITVLVNRGELNSSFMLRSLDDLTSIYEGVEGYKDFVDLISSIQEYISTQDDQEINSFIYHFARLLQSNNYDVKSVESLMKR